VAGFPAPDRANLRLARELRASHKLAILSNADRSLRERLETDIGIRHLFDDIVCSAEVGNGQPEPAIYLLAAERLGLEPPECVFVDDLDTNVEAARQVGMPRRALSGWTRATTSAPSSPPSA